MNILELLKKYAEKGDVFYSLIHGECTLTALRDLTRHNICPTITMENLQGLQLSFYENGTFYDGIGECVIFPSKEQHDWKKWAEEKEAKRKNFQVGDHVFYNKTSLGVVTSANSSTFIINFVKDNNSLMFDQANPVRLEKTDHFDYSYFKPKDYILIRDYKKNGH